ncbi:hypothetical protein N9M29_03250 [Alphaproteobacteria bacterium]|jgi:Na+/H+-dicarboxylate symporter|nr:hypothetical protein [Alphaproteobacteria bacterium]MDA8642486.1 hypothetical protein [Alphaproteobacteria bacterium]MDA8666802.1 hypothetical protein [Alphaproteobacteria bacterium]MDA9590461.1 hypothetical protein [Alphaproteobacteria bacterium]MDB2488499.1 hypothetical protein [Alphaproteobacteria bacterium]
MKKLIETVLRLLPIWFGIGFLGPVLAELYLRTSLQSLFPLQATSAQVYAACIIFGGLYGLVAWRVGRWI